MIFKHALQSFLRKRKCAANIRFQTVFKVLARFVEEGLLGRVLDAEDREVEFQAGEGFVRFDVSEGALERCL